MKKIILNLVFLLVLVSTAMAQEKDYKNGVGLSLRLGENAKDFSLGLGITSPWFWSNSSAIRLNADLPFRADTWKPYASLSLSWLGGTFMKTADIRLYGGGGPLFIFPIDKSEPTVLIGGQGFFGFEFFVNSEKTGFVYFIELGGSGTGSVGKKAQRRYATGFTAMTGFRYTIPVKK